MSYVNPWLDDYLIILDDKDIHYRDDEIFGEWIDVQAVKTGERLLAREGKFWCVGTGIFPYLTNVIEIKFMDGKINIFIGASIDEQFLKKI